MPTQMPCLEIIEKIVKGCESNIQCELIHKHILLCKYCAAFKAKYLGVNKEQVIEAIMEK